MSYIPDLKNLQWIDLSINHKTRRSDIQNGIESSCHNKSADAAPLMIKGAFGVGKTNALCYAFTYAWTNLQVPAFFIDLNKIIELIDLKRQELNVTTVNCQTLIGIIESEVDRLINNLKHKDWNTINGFSNNITDTESINSFLEQVKPLAIRELDENTLKDSKLPLLTKDVVQEAISTDHKALVIIDEFEDKYWKLKQRLDYAGGGPIRELFDYVVKSNSKFYLIIGNGPASGYELSEGEIIGAGSNTAQDRRIDVLNIPSPSPRTLANSFLANDPIGYINFIWWLSRSRPGLIEKARKQIGNFEILLEKDYATIISENDIFSQQVDSQGETVKYLNYKFFEENLSPLLKNTLLKSLLVNICPQTVKITDYRSDLAKYKNLFIGSKRLVDRQHILSYIESDLISNDPNRKISLRHFQENGRYQKAEWKIIGFYINIILESMSDSEGRIAFGVLDNNNWQALFASSFLKPLLQMVYDFIVQFEDSGTIAIQDGCDYLLEVINSIDSSVKDGKLDASFPGIVYKDNNEDEKTFQAVNINNSDELYLQLSPFTIRQAFEQPIGEPKLNYQNEFIDPIIDSLETTNVIIRHYDSNTQCEIVFIPDLSEQLLTAYIANVDQYLTNHFIDKYVHNGRITLSVVYLVDSKAIENLKESISTDENGIVEPICKINKVTFKRIDEFGLQFPRQMMVFIDSLCKIGIVAAARKQLSSCIDEKDSSFYSLKRITESILQPCWSDRKEVRRTIEHYSKGLFEGEKSAVKSIIAAMTEMYLDGVSIEFQHKREMRETFYRNKINNRLFEVVSGMDSFTKRVICLFLLEHQQPPKDFLDILKTATDITKVDAETASTSKYLNFFHFKQFIQSSGSFLKEHIQFTLDDPFYKSLRSFYSLLNTKEEKLNKIDDIAKYLQYDKSFINSYHAFLDGPLDSEIFSESLYNLKYFTSLNIDAIKIDVVQALNASKKELSDSLTQLTELLSDYEAIFEIKDPTIKYDDDARKVINRIIVPLLDILESTFSYSLFVTIHQLHSYIKRAIKNVNIFRADLDKIVTLARQRKESLGDLQEKIDKEFAIPFHKIIFEINGVSKVNCVPMFVKSVKSKHEYDIVFGDQKKYTQSSDYKFDSNDIVKLVNAINESFKDQESKAKKQLIELSSLVDQINEIGNLETKIEQLLNTDNDG